MNRGGGSNGGAGAGSGGGTNPTPPSAYGHYQPYMSPYSSQGLSPGGPYQTPVGVPLGPNSGGPPEQFGNNFNVQGGGYYNHPSPNEDQGPGPTFYGGGPGGGPGGHPPGSAGSPGSRDLSYYGFNNGFGNGGDGGGGGGGPGGNGGSAFYQQQQHQNSQQDNNNKVSNLPGDTASVHEFGDTIKKEQHEQQAVADLKQEQPQQDQSSVTSEATSGGPGGPGPAGPKSEPGNGNDGPQNSDMNNSDNQTSRSQQSTPQDNRNISPKTNSIMNNPASNAGLKRSPASHESSEFEQQFEQSMAAAAAMPHGGGGGPAGTDEYMRQMAMGNQSTEGMPPYNLQMQFGQPTPQQQPQQQIWDGYGYNYPGQQQQHPMHMQQPGMMENNYGMSMNPDAAWWQQQQQQHQELQQQPPQPPQPQMTRPDYSSNFRAPPSIGGLQAPGSWMLRGPRPRNDRRGPGRPRIGPGKVGGPAVVTDSMITRHLRPRLMSPPPGSGGFSISPFSTGPGGEMGSPSPAGASDGGPTPGSPSPSGFDHHPAGIPGMPGGPRPDGLPTNPPGGVSMIPSPPVGSPSTNPDVPTGPAFLEKGGKSGSKNANKKRYHCEICGKKFSTAWYVRVHRKSHSGERPYICHNCGKGFMLPNVLQVHLRKCEKNNPGGTGAGPNAPGAANNPPSKNPNAGRGGPPGGPPVSLPNGPIGPQSALGVLDPGGPNGTSGPGPDGQLSQDMPQSSPAGLPQQGFLEVAGGFNVNNGGSNTGPNQLYNQRYDMGIPGGMPTPPFHPMGGGEPPMFEQFLSDQQMYSSSNSSSGSVGGPGGGYNAVAVAGVTPSGIGSPGGGAGDPRGNVPAHFLANDRPRDEGGGFLRSLAMTIPSCEMCGSGEGSPTCSKCAPLHPTNKILVCTLCDKRFALKALFDAHVKSHQTALLRGQHPVGTNCNGGSGPGGLTDTVVGHNYFTTELPPSPSFSPGIPTPQSSLDSLSCFATASRPSIGPLLSGYDAESGTRIGRDPLSELTATVEATVPLMGPGNCHPVSPPSLCPPSVTSATAATQQTAPPIVS